MRKIRKCGVLVMGCLIMLASAAYAQQSVKNHDAYVFVGAGAIASLDPQWGWEVVNTEIQASIYERLVSFLPDDLTTMEPILAERVPTVENGLLSTAADGSARITFEVREGVYFQKVGVRAEDGSIVWKEYDSLFDGERAKIVPGYGQLTPEDVKYTLMRLMLMDRTGGGTFLVLPAFCGYGSSKQLAMDIAGVTDFALVDEATETEVFRRLDATMTTEGNKIIISLPVPFAPSVSAFAASVCGIVDKEWTIAQGGWPGTADTWIEYCDPAEGEETLHDIANGTGPYELVRWDKQTYEITLERFDGYRKGPAALKYVVRKVVPEFTTRKLLIQEGDVDSIWAANALLPQLEGLEGVRVVKNVPSMTWDTINFQWNIQGENNPAIGSGQLDGNGIPRDFFADINVRKAFCYAFDYATYIDEINAGMGIPLKGPMFKGTMGYREDQPQYYYDPVKATEYFKAAFGGKLWTVGFRFTAYHCPLMAETFRMSLSLLQERLLDINPKFRMDIQTLEWPTFFAKWVSTQDMPLYLGYYTIDYPDPHNWASVFWGSDYFYGAISGADFTRLCQDVFDPIIQQAVKIYDPAKREPLYDQLQRLGYEYATNIFTMQEVANIVERNWLGGLYYHMATMTGIPFWGVSKTGTQ